MKRNAEFIRSILPQNTRQLLFLAGVVSLFISPLLPWTLLSVRVPLFGILGPIWVATFGIQFAGAAGYFMCFRPAHQSRGQVFRWILLPACVGILARCGLQIYAVIALASAEIQNDHRGSLGIATEIGLSIGAIEGLGAGFPLALIGIVCIVVFLLRSRHGSTSLPLSLPRSSTLETDDAVSWSRWHLLIWLLLVRLTFDWCGLAVLALLRNIQGAAPVLSYVWVARALVYTVSFAIFIPLAVWIAGREVWTDLQRSLRMPRPESFLLAIAFPIGTVYLGSLMAYASKTVWTIVFQTGSSLGSPFSSYFSFPYGEAVLVLLIPVFFEEMVFRGFLQSRLVRRYGPLRGIILASMVWAAWHFSGDFSKIQHLSSVLAQLVLRITLCVGMGLVLGWLTMRTHSILPATLAHAIYDAFAGLRLTEWKLGQSLLINFSWGLLAYFLFRYWPVGTGGEAERPGHSMDLGAQAMLQL